MSPDVRKSLEHLAQVCNDLADTLPISAREAFAARSNHAIGIVEKAIDKPKQEPPLTGQKTPTSSQP